MKDNRETIGIAPFDDELGKRGITVVRCANCSANLYIRTGEASQGKTLCPLCSGLSRATAPTRTVPEITPIPKKRDPLILRLVVSGLHWLRN